mmetsp:Transcript_25232/g.71868  ORF Transcript_25232/g.71868 Transcript_25232/m.71868 type:complete len:399 (-) Transcript_25232:941-2137(-)
MACRSRQVKGVSLRSVGLVAVRAPVQQPARRVHRARRARSEQRCKASVVACLEVEQALGVQGGKAAEVAVLAHPRRRLVVAGATRSQVRRGLACEALERSVDPLHIGNSKGVVDELRARATCRWCPASPCRSRATGNGTKLRFQPLQASGLRPSRSPRLRRTRSVRRRCRPSRLAEVWVQLADAVDEGAQLRCSAACTSEVQRGPTIRVGDQWVQPWMRLEQLGELPAGHLRVPRFPVAAQCDVQRRLQPQRWLARPRGPPGPGRRPLRPGTAAVRSDHRSTGRTSQDEARNLVSRKVHRQHAASVGGRLRGLRHMRTHRGVRTSSQEQLSRSIVALARRVVQRREAVRVLLSDELVPAMCRAARVLIAHGLGALGVGEPREEALDEGRAILLVKSVV